MNLFFLITLGPNHLCQPSPRPFKASHHWQLHQIGNGNHHSLWNLSKKYGPAMHLQLGQNQVLVDCHLIPTNGQRGVKEPWCWVLHEPKLHAQKKLTYNFLTIAFSSYNDSWRQMRKLFMMELFAKSLKVRCNPLSAQEKSMSLNWLTPSLRIRRT